MPNVYNWLLHGLGYIHTLAFIKCGTYLTLGTLLTLIRLIDTYYSVTAADGD